MANFECASRTNYFRVTDEEKLDRLLADIEDACGTLHYSKEKDGQLFHVICSYGFMDFDWFEECTGYDFFEKLQQILPEGEVFIYMEAGHEKLRYVDADAIILTKDERRKLNFESIILKECERMGYTAPVLSY